MALIGWEHPTATHRILCPPTPIPPTLVPRTRPSLTPQARQLRQNHPNLSIPGASTSIAWGSPKPSAVSSTA